MSKTLTTNTYPTLVTQLKKVFVEGLKRIEEEKVKAYWQTGKLISEHLLANKDRADYGTTLFEDLSKDLGIDLSTLQRIVKFYRAFPIPARGRELRWSHYRTLITISDDKRRAFFTDQAIKKEWDARQLGEAIRLDRLEVEAPQPKPTEAAPKLSVTRARLFAYKIMEPSFIHPVEEKLVVDLGFKVFVHTEIKNLRVKDGEIIESVKNGESYSFKRSDAAPKELYTYKALVERVVDADTFLLNIDLGFNSWVRERIRLRGIDAPELATTEGKNAKAFVEARLKETPCVVVKTHKNDKYGRFVVDVFYQPVEEKDGAGGSSGANEVSPEAVLNKGVFLNQELLNLGLAVLM